MTAAKFLETRSTAWDRLELLVNKATRSGLHRMDDAELHEITRLYPAIVVDVARARMYQIDRITQDRINQLAIKAHGLLYRRKSRPLSKTVIHFLRQDYPVLFRSMWSYLVLATVIFLIGFIGSYVMTVLRPANAYIFVPYGLDVGHTDSQVSSEDVSERYRTSEKTTMSAAITTNNIAVAFNAFALGITAAVGTILILLYNALMLGAFVGHFANHGLSGVVWSFLTGHGMLEIFAILIAGASGLRMGISIACPGRLNRIDSLRKGARQAVLLVLGTIPMFMIAGLIESFVTPSYLPGWAKIAVGITVWAIVMGYLLFVGDKPSEKVTP